MALQEGSAVDELRTGFPDMTPRTYTTPTASDKKPSTQTRMEHSKMFLSTEILAAVTTSARHNWPSGNRNAFIAPPVASCYSLWHKIYQLYTVDPSQSSSNDADTRMWKTVYGVTFRPVIGSKQKRRKKKQIG